jgi:hypothetical protein
VVYTYTAGPTHMSLSPDCRDIVVVQPNRQYLPIRAYAVRELRSRMNLKPLSAMRFISVRVPSPAMANTVHTSSACRRRTMRSDPPIFVDIYRPSRMKSATRSPIIMVVPLVLARMLSTMIEASATRSPCTPCTFPYWSTTAIVSEAGPILHVPA